MVEILNSSINLFPSLIAYGHQRTSGSGQKTLNRNPKKIAFERLYQLKFHGSVVSLFRNTSPLSLCKPFLLIFCKRETILWTIFTISKEGVRKIFTSLENSESSFSSLKGGRMSTVRTIGCQPKDGRYLTNFPARREPPPLTGGKSCDKTKTVFLPAIFY